MKNRHAIYEFEAVFTPQAEGGFTVEIPSLPGCVSEGDTLEEAEENIQEAGTLYLATLEERGIPLPETKPFKVLKMNITVIRSGQVKKRMPKLPVIRPRELVRALKRLGFVVLPF